MSSLPAKYRFPVPEVAYEAQRTPTCPTGMRGRMAVFEVMEMNPHIEKLVLENPNETKLWEAARSQGMLTMREDALMKAFNKKVPFSEVNNLSRAMLSSDTEEEVPQPEAAK